MSKKRSEQEEIVFKLHSLLNLNQHSSNISTVDSSALADVQPVVSRKS
jgi:hypothetical protein